MSVECSLKSLMCSKDNQQEAEVVYAQLRKLGHDLTKLLKRAGTVQITQSDKDFLRAATKRGVHLRYSLDLFNLSTCEIINKDSVTFTIDEEYVNRFFRIADGLSKQAQTAHRTSFASPPKLMTETQMESYVRRLRQLEPKRK